jgi:hypothetical protein
MNLACTLFDAHYLFKGIALLKSLNRHWKRFEIWVLCMDKITYTELSKLEIPNTRLVELEDFLTKDLKKVQKERSRAEFCWTCASSFTKYVLSKNPKARFISYMDADIYFYSSPDVIFKYLKNKSIMAIEHRFPKDKKFMEETTGKFNVSMVTFKNDRIGNECLNTWSKQCLEWCFWKKEDGKLGDQLYLNDWPHLYRNNFISMPHLGVGVAPWNLRTYKISLIRNNVYIETDRLVFFHFHQLEIQKNRFIRTTVYKIPDIVGKYIYDPYEKAIKVIKNQITDENRDKNIFFSEPKIVKEFFFTIYKFFLGF